MQAVSIMIRTRVGANEVKYIFTAAFISADSVECNEGQGGVFLFYVLIDIAFVLFSDSSTRNECQG